MHQAQHKLTEKSRKQTASPRDLEADLLLKAAARLQAISDDWDTQGSAKSTERCCYNRRLWSIFVTSVTDRTIRCPRRCARTSPISACS